MRSLTLRLLPECPRTLTLPAVPGVLSLAQDFERVPRQTGRRCRREAPPGDSRRDENHGQTRRFRSLGSGILVMHRCQNLVSVLSEEMGVASRSFSNPKKCCTTVVALLAPHRRDARQAQNVYFPPLVLPCGDVVRSAVP